LSRVEDPNNSSGLAAGAIPPSPFDSQLETKAKNEADETPRQPFDAQVEAELMREFQRPDAPFGMTARVVATMGVLAIVALLFVIMMPGFRRSDTASSFSADVQQFKAALSRKPEQQPPSEDAARPAIAEFQSLLASSNGAAARADHDKPDELLRQFKQWRQKTNSAANGQ
jgi:hypothetical protein